MKNKFAIFLLIAGSVIAVLSAFMVHSVMSGQMNAMARPELRGFAYGTLLAVCGPALLLGLAAILSGAGLRFKKTNGRAPAFVLAAILVATMVPVGQFFTRKTALSPVPIEERPMYGGVAETPEIRAANEAFIRQSARPQFFGSVTK